MMLKSEKIRSVFPFAAIGQDDGVPAATPISRETQCELRRAIMVEPAVIRHRVPLLVAAVALATSALVGGLLALY